MSSSALSVKISCGNVRVRHQIDVGVRPYEVCYPTSKRAAENLCASYSKQYGMETVVVRPCHTYGPSITPTDNRANVQFISRNVLV
ncbi:NAD-dependent epimerase/dehydratase family protein [Ruminococcus sp. AF25-23LB]|nr:NAD-dependent epimerase/dehydratase family protein [Ruminococcus sp. AF25-23LB]